MDMPENTNRKAKSQDNIKPALRIDDIIPPFRSAAEKQRAAELANNSVPKFDLAEEIMSEHRKTTTKNRRSPQAIKAGDDKEFAELDSGAVSFSIADIFVRDKVVSEIVARDIEYFTCACK